VSDFFAEFGLPRKAWLDAENVKSRHHALMAELHPDKASGDAERSSLLNDGRRVLENHASRLRHLTKLIKPTFQPTQKPSPDWDFFSRAGTTTLRSLETARKKTEATSPIAKAVLQREATDCLKELKFLDDDLKIRAEHLASRTRSADELAFEPAELWNLAEEWTFLDRCQTSVQEALTALRVS
jgi:hypothetical protein